jgi:hypothetical protein
MDDDGVGGPPVPLRVRITVADDRIALDFTGTGPQVPGDVNVVYLALVATVYYPQSENRIGIEQRLICIRGACPRIKRVDVPTSLSDSRRPL